MGTVKLSRHWDANGNVWPCVAGSIGEWPIGAARELVALVASWENCGWWCPTTEALTFTEIGEDLGGAHEFEVTPISVKGYTPAIAGAAWDAALDAVLAAQRG